MSDIPDQIEVYGELKTIRAWARDSRCEVSEKTIKARLKKEWSAEEAVLSPKGAREPFVPALDGIGKVIGYRRATNKLVIQLGDQMLEASAKQMGATAIGKIAEIRGGRLHKLR